MGLLQTVAFSALMIAQASPAPSPSAGPPAYDVFVYVLSEPQRNTIDRDSRCRDVHVQLNTYVTARGADLRAGVDALKGLEMCAAMQRIGEWGDYRDYLLTAAGAVAYQVGVDAGEPKAFTRALRDLALVHGYEAAGSINLEMTSRSEPAGLGSAEAGRQEMSNLGPAQANINNRTETRHMTGYAGPYGELATRVGSAARDALRLLNPEKAK